MSRKLAIYISNKAGQDQRHYDRLIGSRTPVTLINASDYRAIELKD